MSARATPRHRSHLGPACAAALAAALAAPLGGCRGQVSDQPPILVERNMYHQERYDPQSYSGFFADHATMRVPVEGTLARESYEEDETIATGVLADGSAYVPTIPAAVVERAGGLAKMAERGHERFDIYCAPCHGRTGDGQGMVARVPAGFPPLPKLTEARICEMPDGQLYATIANGVRNMPPYAAQVPLADRWAIVAYVRALELSRLSSGDVKP